MCNECWYIVHLYYIIYIYIYIQVHYISYYIIHIGNPRSGFNDQGLAQAKQPAPSEQPNNHGMCWVQKCHFPTFNSCFLTRQIMNFMNHWIFGGLRGIPWSQFWTRAISTYFWPRLCGPEYHAPSFAGRAGVNGFSRHATQRRDVPVGRQKNDS